MTSPQLRKVFLDFFRERGHAVVPSSPLVPHDDPSLLFTNAGMVQFKPLWTGTIELPYRRATSIQKCLRLSDLDNVGRTRRHHTFFEMLGNFSFGDYFKEEAIAWAWEFLTRVLLIDTSRLLVSVHVADQEAYRIWRDKIGLASERVFRLGDDTNFWGPAGNSGPCGPCSEIYYDLGADFSCGKPSCAPGCDCDRYAEVWNLVFPQFDQTATGERVPLRNRGVDTGMGMERLLTIVQGQRSNFQTDLFRPIIDELAGLTGFEYGRDPRTDLAANVVADHVRALVFAIADGVIPSNEDRGYVLRRILRRAVRLARGLGVREPTLFRLVPRVVARYEDPYTELTERREEIGLVIKSEEERFLATLEKGLAQLETICQTQDTISCEQAFLLYDTYGFPIELTREIAGEKNIHVDDLGFAEKMEQARLTARAKTAFQPKGEWVILKEGTGAFLGYERFEVDTEILRYNRYDKYIDIVLAESPFYAEAGGQIGEKGTIHSASFDLEVIDTYWHQAMITCHGRLIKGEFSPAALVHARVDLVHRRESARAHTATHLLHAALRQVLGEHARQQGSLVEPGRLRFDFAHFRPLNQDEMAAIENFVNDKIMGALPVEKFLTTQAEARALGAMALFGEKYGDTVRVVRIPGVSIELCGGIHVDNTGEIGMLKIVGQESVAAGIRRVEAIVGMHLLADYRSVVGTIREAEQLLGGGSNLTAKCRELMAQLQSAVRRNEQYLDQLARIEADRIAAGLSAQPSGYVLERLDNFGTTGMRLVADRLREKTRGVVGVLYEVEDGRMHYLVFVTDDLIERHPANRLIREIGKAIGGGGGGKPHLAEGGGGDPDRLAALRDVLRACGA